MQLEIDPTSDVPIYQQIRDRIVEGIATGSLTSGDSLPSVRVLASSLAMNPNTVAKAYNLLRAEGFIAANKKLGTFVRGNDAPIEARSDSYFADEWRSRLFTLLAEAKAKGMSTADLEHAFELTLAGLGGTSKVVTP